jgi:hypothetical protein
MLLLLLLAQKFLSLALGLSSSRRFKAHFIVHFVIIASPFLRFQRGEEKKKEESGVCG